MNSYCYLNWWFLVQRTRWNVIRCCRCTAAQRLGNVDDPPLTRAHVRVPVFSVFFFFFRRLLSTSTPRDLYVFFFYRPQPSRPAPPPEHKDKIHRRRRVAVPYNSDRVIASSTRSRAPAAHVTLHRHFAYCTYSSSHSSPREFRERKMLFGSSRPPRTDSASPQFVPVSS